MWTCQDVLVGAAPRERNWLNFHAAGKEGWRFFFLHKYIRLVILHTILYENKVVWNKIKRIEDGNIGFTCIYIPNISMERKRL